MAQKVQVTLIDDIDGTEASTTIPFSVAGVAYEIDLSDANAAEMQKSLARYTDAGRRIGAAKRAAGTARSGSTAPARPAAPVVRGGRRADAADIRKWAIQRGLMSETARGRIKASVYEAYDAAH